MARSIELVAAGRKGRGKQAINVRRAAEHAIARAAAEPESEALQLLLRAAAEAAGKILSRVVTGDVVEVRASVIQNPRGDWGVSLLVDVCQAPPKRRSAKPRA